MTRASSSLEGKLSDLVRKVLSLAAKDVRCELRTRYALNALLMFAVVTLVVIGLTAGQGEHSSHMHASLIWIVILFSLMQALSGGFVKEEESGTADTLRVYAEPRVVYLGKLLLGLALAWALLVVLVPLYLILMDLDVDSMSHFLLCLLLGSTGIAASTTIIAAIVSRASIKGALFAVLSFPLLLPVLLSAIFATEVVLRGGEWSDMWPYVKILIAYPIIVVTVSYMLFDYVWEG